MENQKNYFDVVKYIREATALGMTRQDIKIALAKFNYSDDQIDDFLRETDRLSITAQALGPAKPLIYATQAKSQSSAGIGLDNLWGNPAAKTAKSKSKSQRQKNVSYVKFLIGAMVIALLIISGAAAFYFYNSNTSKVTSTEELLPHDTYWYLKINTNPDSQQNQNLQNLSSNLPYADQLPQVLSYFLINSEDKSDLEKFASRYGSYINNLSQITLALTNNEFASALSQDLKQSLVIIGEKISDENITNLLALLKTDSDIAFVESKIQGQKIYRLINKQQDDHSSSNFFSLANLDCYLTFFDNILVVAFDEDNLKEIVLLYKSSGLFGKSEKTKTSLIQNKDYQNIVQEITRPNLLENYLANIEFDNQNLGLLSNWNLAALGNLFADENISNIKAIPGNMEMQIVRAVEGSLKIDSVLWDSKNTNKYSAEFSKKDSLSHLLPQKLAGNFINMYFEGNDLELTHTEIENALEQLQNETTSDLNATRFFSDLAGATQMFSQYISLDIEKELLPHLKGNYCLLIAPAPNGEKPAIAMVAKVINPNELSAKLSNMRLDPNALKEFIYTAWYTFFEPVSEKYLELSVSDLSYWEVVEFETEQYLGHNIYTTNPQDLDTPILDDLIFFNYAVIGDKLVIASSASALKDIVASLSSPFGVLTENQYFAQSYNLASEQVEGFWWQYLEGWSHLLEYGIMDYYNNLESDLGIADKLTLSQLQQITALFTPFLHSLKIASAYYVTDGNYQKNYFTLNIQELTLEEKQRMNDLMEMFFKYE